MSGKIPMPDADPRWLSQPVAQADRTRVPIEDLLRGRREVVIVHKGEEYLLRVTRNGKLILTK